MKPGSLRLRLLVLSSLSLAAALTLAAICLAYIFERHMERRVAQELEVRLEDLVGALERGPDGSPRLSRNLTDSRYRTPYSGVYWQITGGRRTRCAPGRCGTTSAVRSRAGGGAPRGRRDERVRTAGRSTSSNGT